jgi:glycosyltransferase involved in cell wall biosynthesis
MVAAVSVIIPTYNRRGTLGRAIESVLAQTCSDLELIVIDDGSTDGSADLVRGFVDPRVQLIELDHRQGANVARNAGIAAAQSGIIAFLDSDDVYLPERLNRVVGLMQADPGIDVVLSSFLSIKGPRQTRCINPGAVISAELLETALVAHSLFIAGSAITVRRSTLERVGSFDPAVGRMQDRDLLLRIARSTGATLTEPMDWHKHDSEGSISGSRPDYLDALARLLDRHPKMTAEYRTLVLYLVTRPILTQLSQGHFIAAARLWNVARRNPVLRAAGRPSLWRYIEGKRQRKESRRRLIVAALGNQPTG